MSGSGSKREGATGPLLPSQLVFRTQCIALSAHFISGLFLVNMPNRKHLLLPAIFFCLLPLGCGPESPDWNVVIVTFDTTRADRIGCYGDEQAQTPTLDALAADGVLFEQAMTSVPITLPSHSTLMTGKVPFAHGVRDNGLFVLGDEQLTLAEILRDQGYRTGAAIASYPLLATSGINQGFEFFDDHISGDYEDLYGERVFPKDRLFFDERPAAQVNEAVLPWLEENHQEPFFLWLHYFDPHHPLQPPAPYDQSFAHDPYRGEIAYADESLGIMLAQLKRLGVDDRTLIIFTADHGEGLDEHNESTHSMLLYQSTLHVPLIMRLPPEAGKVDIQGRRVAERVGLVDVVPTVLDVLGLDIPEKIQGRSLASYLTESEPQAVDRRRELYAETISPRLSRNWGELRALVVDDHKYVHGPIRELYGLEDDPRELQNLIEQEPEKAHGLEKRLERFVARHAVEGLDASVALDDEAARKLQALGYIQNAGDAVGAITEELRTDGDPPQDHVHTISAYSQAKGLLFAGRWIEGKELIMTLLTEDPDNPHYLEMLFSTELRLGRLEEAMAIMDRLEVLNPPFPPADRIFENKARVLLEQGKLDEARLNFERAQELEETAGRAYWLAKILLSTGRPAEQRLQLEKALELDPDLVPARIDLAISFAQSGDLEAAEASFQQAVQSRPYDPRAHYNLGAFRAHQGQPEAAIERFRRAAELKPNYLAAHYAIFEILYDSGDVEAATKRYQILNRIAPESLEARVARQRMGAES